jgi:hypothetical protein
MTVLEISRKQASRKTGLRSYNKPMGCDRLKCTALRAVLSSLALVLLVRNEAVADCRGRRSDNVDKKDKDEKSGHEKSGQQQGGKRKAGQQGGKQQGGQKR